MRDMQSLPTKILEWIKSNKLATALIAILVFFGLQNNTPVYMANRQMMGETDTMMAVDAMPAPMMAKTSLPIAGGGGMALQESYNPSDRMVATDTNLSLKVTDVKTTIDRITTLAFENGGFMINSQMSSPEGGSSGSVSLKVASDKLSPTLEAIRGLGVKVVSEYVHGTDVTDQYTDIEERLRIVTATKQKMEEIMRSATKISDMLEVQRELINLQAEIDSLKGQQQYLDKTTQLASITVYLSTDELALPYAPDQSWRPQQVFKEAVRSLIQTGRNIADLAIWVGVYAPIWISAALIYWFWKKRHAKL